MERGEGGIPEPVRTGSEIKMGVMCTVEAKIATTTKINIPTAVMNALRLTS